LKTEKRKLEIENAIAEGPMGECFVCAVCAIPPMGVWGMIIAMVFAAADELAV